MLIWRIVAAAVVAAMAGLASGGFSVEPAGLIVVAAASFGCEALAWFYRTRRREPDLSATLTAVAQMVALSAAAGALSYAVAARGGSFWDASFAAWDRALGLDWFGYATFMDGRPDLSRVCGWAYDSLKLQFLLVPLALGFTGRTRPLAEFTAAFALAALAVVLVSGLMPALGIYPSLGIAPDRFPHVAARDVYDTATTVIELRRGGARLLSLSDLYGIITFPSFHAVGGTLVALALWRVPGLRWPALALDALTIAATPTHGGHHVVDVAAGVAVALAAALVARRIVRRDAAAARAEPVAAPSTGVVQA